MSDTLVGLTRKIQSATELQSVVRTMKAIAASSIGQFEKSVRSLADYYRSVELGLGACFRIGKFSESPEAVNGKIDSAVIGAIVFGSDQGLVGQFNDTIADFVVKTLETLPGKRLLWAVGERVHASLIDRGLTLEGLFPLPGSVEAIAPLVGRIQIECEAYRAKGEYTHFYIFHNRPQAGALYAPVSQRLLPLDAQWQSDIAKTPWPTKLPPEVIPGEEVALPAFIREYLFISLFQACAESLASENASRLAAMERAEKNITELVDELHGSFHRLRQNSIDEELFDVVSGYESLAGENATRKKESE
ncbi:MAG: F0F1 ATP synthase subunit gamma [Fibrobacteria bacterium]